MKYLQKIRFIFVGCFIFFYSSATIASSLLAAIIITNDHAAMIHETLQPLLNAGITDFIILDQKSSDQTVLVAKEWFEINNIDNFTIITSEFDNFALEKNYVLQVAEEKFINTSFLLMIDADWILQNPQELLNFCKQEEKKQQDLYEFRVLGFNIDLFSQRLIRCKSNVLFLDQSLEALTVRAEKINNPNIYFKLHHGYYNLNKTKKRLCKEQKFLLLQAEKDPNDESAIFLLAQNYFNSGDFLNAVEFFKKFIMFSKNQDQIYAAHCKLASAYFILTDEKNLKYHYIEAFKTCPYRADSLILLAQYYYDQGKFEDCYAIAKYSCSISYPNTDVLAEKYLYDFVRYNLASATAYKFNDYEFGLYATKQALNACPQAMYLYDNLKEYQKMIEIYDGN